MTSQVKRKKLFEPNGDCSYLEKEYIEVESLVEYANSLIPGDLYEGERPYAEMFWALHHIIKGEK